jgi:hypothetical protein
LTWAAAIVASAGNALRDGRVLGPVPRFEIFVNGGVHVQVLVDVNVRELV